MSWSPTSFQMLTSLLCDVFNALESACKTEGIAFDFVDEDSKLEDGDAAPEQVGAFSYRITIATVATKTGVALLLPNILQSTRVSS